MSLSLPLTGSPQREWFDVADLVAVTTGERPLLCLPQALRQARDLFAANPAARRVAFIVLRAENDQVDLITVGPRGGWKREWRFGPVPRSARLA